DRAFVRSAEWFDGAQSYLDEHFPPRVSRWQTRLKWTVGIVGVFALGIAVGRYVRPESAVVTEVPLPRATADVAPPVKEAAPVISPIATPARLLVTDSHVASTGCWGPEGSLDAPYEWTSATASLVVRGLVARRRYDVVLGVSDSGHVEHLRFQTPDGAISDEVTIRDREVASPIAFVASDEGALEFTLRMNAWKPAEHVQGSKDARELGVALADIRITDAP
ncbi:MAG TPA: hypothetical protein VHU80_03650, partial [Polyangiaceae bacterium]|nr:hypothetical protein [Polyangiaceae bacterium]